MLGVKKRDIHVAVFVFEDISFVGSRPCLVCLHGRVMTCVGLVCTGHCARVNRESRISESSSATESVSAN
jgi:hypothetical protein